MFDYIPGRWFSSGTSDIVEAIHWADKKVESDLMGKGYNREDITLRDFATDFFTARDPYGVRKRDIKHGHHYDDSYYARKQGYLDNYILKRFGNQTLLSLTDVVIEDWFLDLISVTKKKELHDDTKNKVLTTFKDVLREAVRQGLIPSNPAEKITMINVTANTRTPFTPQEIKLLYPEDDEQMLKVWGSVMWATFFLIFRDTGFRPSQIAALSISSYYPDLHGIFSRNSVGDNRQLKNSIKTTNKGKDYMVGILTAQTERFLNRRIIECQNKKEEYLFLIDKKFFVASTSNKHFTSFGGKIIDMKGRTQYSLRHSFETDLAGRIENKVVAELMAHTAFNPVYDHRSPETLLEELQPVRSLLEKRAALADGSERKVGEQIYSTTAPSSVGVAGGVLGSD